jgi:TolA-binding protein
MKGLLRACAAWVLAAVLSALAADAPDAAAYNAAVRDFDLGLWDRAERNLGEFESKFPDSKLVAEAGARRRFSAAETAFAAGDFGAAAAGFAEVQKSNPAAQLAVLAAVREAESRQREGKPADAAAALRDAAGVFARALESGGPAPVLLRGLLVEGACLVAAKDPAAAVAAVTRAQTLAGSPGAKADCLRALALAKDAAGDAPGAADAASQAADLTIADSSLASGRFDAAALAGRLNRKAGRTDRAAAYFTVVSTTNAPVPLHREAALALGEIAAEAGRHEAARGPLDEFLRNVPLDPEAWRLRLPLGREVFALYLATRGDTNKAAPAALLAEAARNFTQTLAATNAPAEVRGPASLGLGWCLWESGYPGGGADWLAAETNFAAAAALLPDDPRRVVARFKYGDCLLARGGAASALTNFLDVANSSSTAALSLKEPALWQAVLAAIAAGNPEAAKSAMGGLLALNPRGEPAVRSALLVGQYHAKAGDDAGARDILAGYLEKFPDTPLRADVELALASADLRARRWTNAIAQLDRWIATNVAHPSRPRAEFDRAWAHAQSGSSTNAEEEFKGLAARFPANPLAVTAQLWLAGHFFSLEKFAQAELACVAVTTNAAWRGDPAWHRARLLAAESARRRQSWASAKEQLLALLNDKSTPPDIQCLGYFHLGELNQERSDELAGPPVTRFQDAMAAFLAAAQFTNSSLVGAAIGQAGNCQLQIAAGDSTALRRALELYNRALETPAADVVVRCQAAAGRGAVLEKLSAATSGAEAKKLREQALDAWLDVVQGRFLRSGERADAWWLKESGREAGRLLEEAGRWEAAASLYERLARELPASAAAWNARAAAARRAGPG